MPCEAEHASVSFLETLLDIVERDKEELGIEMVRAIHELSGECGGWISPSSSPTSFNPHVNLPLLLELLDQLRGGTLSEACQESLESILTTQDAWQEAIAYRNAVREALRSEQNRFAECVAECHD